MPAFIFKWSAECIRNLRFLQAMKHNDPLLLAWQKTASCKGDRAAIFDATGGIARSFQAIETQASAFEAKMDKLLPGAVVAVQIGNHEDWPAVFIACLRKQLVVLPLDQSIGEQQRDPALEICKASALISALSDEAAAREDARGVSCLRIPRPNRADATANWGENVPSLLKLTSGT